MTDYADLLGLPELTPWQKRILAGFLDPSAAGVPWREVTVSRGRSAGRAAADRYALRGALALGGHVHVCARDGLWCVTGTGEQLATFGPLWERLATHQCQPVRVIYDEPFHFSGQGQ
jgi:hypothetical protein